MIDPFDTIFESSMIGSSGVIISCPDQDNAPELMRILTKCGVVWCTGDSPMANENAVSADKYNWLEYRENTVYYVTKTRKMSFGSKRNVSGTGYTKCTFHGTEPDFEISDAGFEAIISAAGN